MTNDNENITEGRDFEEWLYEHFGIDSEPISDKESNLNREAIPNKKEALKQQESEKAEKKSEAEEQVQIGHALKIPASPHEDKVTESTKESRQTEEECDSELLMLLEDDFSVKPVKKKVSDSEISELFSMMRPTIEDALMDEGRSKDDIRESAYEKFNKALSDTDIPTRRINAFVDSVLDGTIGTRRATKEETKQAFFSVKTVIQGMLDEGELSKEEIRERGKVAHTVFTVNDKRGNELILDQDYIDELVDSLVDGTYKDDSTIRNKQEFIDMMNERWVKVLGSRTVEYFDIKNKEGYQLKAVENYYNEYVDDKYGKPLFEHWDDQADVVSEIRRTDKVEEVGIQRDGLDKYYYIYDRKLGENFEDLSKGFETFDSIFETLGDEAEGCPSFHKNMNDILKDGKYLNENLYLIVGGPGDGKSFDLATEAVGITMMGKRVAMVSTELNKKDSISRLLQIRYDERDLSKVKERYENSKEKGLAPPLGNMVYQHTGYHSTTNDVFKKLREAVPRTSVMNDEEYEAAIENFYDIIIMDYMYDLEPNRKVDDQYDKLRIVGENLIELGKEFNCPILTATQSNNSTTKKDGSREKDAGFGSIAGSNRVAHVASLVSFISKDANNPRMRRMTIAKNRHASEMYQGEGEDLYYDFGRSGKWTALKEKPDPIKEVGDKSKKCRDKVMQIPKSDNVIRKKI